MSSSSMPLVGDSYGSVPSSPTRQRDGRRVVSENEASVSAASDVALQLDVEVTAHNYRPRRDDIYLTAAQQLITLHGDMSCDCPQIGVTSLSRRRGVSTVSRRLAVAAADLLAQPVLFGEVRRDRRPITRTSGQAAATFNSRLLPTDHPYIQTWETSPLTCLATEPESRERLITQLKDWRSDFSLSLFDLPVVEQLALAGPLLDHLDSVVLVVQPEVDRRDELVRTREQLRRLGLTISAVILNKQRRYLPQWLLRWL
ncbi:MAG: hypothetical protein KDA71_24475 [Planctomycetales bacterium]|nr:hypothetical protein [Planctomycetales bacterium]